MILSPLPLRSWGFTDNHSSGEEIRQQYNLPDDPAKRRKHFLSEKHRETFKFEAGRLYEGDFFNPYIDFSSTFHFYQPKISVSVFANWPLEFSLRLPGFSISVLR